MEHCESDTALVTNYTYGCYCSQQGENSLMVSAEYLRRGEETKWVLMQGENKQGISCQFSWAAYCTLSR